ncbi:hypothetical protein A3C98_03540 [Candidatus Roizmanbacteria bacterium RIFCSPHIGHO2_02_FULL_37_15]|uniref:Uncharacterized protein n=1 Tax=Candidatus Roizmanbacteria bacterium RIFCSPLOWO2_01_FULL_37_16 TaxID=1802058 RepID=A0A1F7IIY1_9BACT|nr:MAG: hypothetical protein A2859_05185 [Candidatus Roizmanbacteria bacterium RIFCSPHIGHO2_01_FULL_37_16b]OGK20446.1 MAG: hypothetical protein A3C98_03540 [Candidatus Roizmanbacteria bacterium RIFCSPHIGHO2_02_FULL_37_15]OGK34047.1 MAG: hypothetical protein A3F57_02490 [Candidatus Roizmanbacteria bacterium RIFCSPHIGHO2_12_FULL_36_11]OGK43297.1 MAG: hypothetical protein A3B40_02285 [Candidatus Roizmanbacteria bacterium RIFCSPLOWO2_01_FULL_37_16]
MVHLSKQYLDKEKLRKLYQLFFELLSRSANKDNFLLIITDFISPPEQIMISKRIAIIYLLTKGLTSSVIADYLKVSKSTVSKYSLLFYEKETESIQIIRRIISKGKILGFIDDIFSDLLIQPGVKIGHWQLKHEHKRRKEERKALDV